MVNIFSLKNYLDNIEKKEIIELHFPAWKQDYKLCPFYEMKCHINQIKKCTKYNRNNSHKSCLRS